MGIPISRPSIKRKDMDSVLSCMVSDTIGPDRISKQLVDAIGEYLKRKGGLALREYPRAVELALEGLGLGAGSRVVGSALLPALYADAFEALGIEFIPADVSETTPVITPQTVQEALASEATGAADVRQDAAANHGTTGADALIVDTSLGFCPDLEGLSALGVPIIEDISQGLGAHTGDRLAGTFARYTIIGLEPEHIVTAGGGAVVIGAGRRESSWLKIRGEELPPEVLLPDVNSALGLTQIKEIERFLEKRRELAPRFIRSLSGGRHRMPAQPGDGENVFFSFPVVLETGMNEVIAYARKHDVEVVPAFSGSLAAFRAGMEERVPNARGYLMRCARFPLYPLLKNSESERIARVLATLP
ncbi:MAG: DegT/DnrJ/EryC1/StrS aminotransferase family protein [Spirochaetes bacterium]|jgi:dTDP-4-amino-4,6-dideoxygalactose transaminase|nr:DegT/DnrJ/EryC1/StrS aminotransferase family protein [Spirochaetota bacterium]